MLTFVGTVKDFKEYISGLITLYGPGCTLKEVLEHVQN